MEKRLRGKRGLERRVLEEIRLLKVGSKEPVKLTLPSSLSVLE